MKGLAVIMLSLAVLAWTASDCFAPDDCYCWACLSDGSGGRICTEGYCTGGETCSQHEPTSCHMGTNCGGHAGCFLAGAYVDTPDGRKLIEELAVGDEVLSLTGDDPTSLIPGTVERTFKVVQCGYVVINGTIRVTDAHPFRVGDDWVLAGDLTIGQTITSKSGSGTIVVSIERVDRAIRAYNIEVSGSHTFFVEGLLVHNKGPDPRG